MLRQTVCCKCRPVQHGQPAFHRSVSQPVDMDLTGLGSFPGGPGWKASDGAAGSGGSAMWNVAPSTGESTLNCCYSFTYQRVILAHSKNELIQWQGIRRLSVCKLLRKSLLLACKWPDRQQTCTRWSSGKPSSRVCSKSRSKVTC